MRGLYRMLIIPVSSKISWKNPPVAAIGLIIVNCLIYLIFQINDDIKMRAAVEHYVSSGLSKIEIPHYIEYCRANTVKCDIPDNAGKLTPEESYPYSLKIQSDPKFLDLLHQESLITPQNPDYKKWKTARTTFEAMLKDVVYWEYGFRPAFPSVVTGIASMFLHGGFSHLFGNMLFLWFMGCIIELGWGRIKFLALYLCSGICAVLLFGLIYHNSGTPLVGASGAIAGLMGAVTMLYAGKKIKIFFSVGFYFNYLYIRAWMLFPVWVGLEFYHLFFGGVSSVAYVAHIGGLISGGSIGVIYRKWFSVLDDDVLTEEVVDEISPMIENALNLIGKLELEDARTILVDVLQKDAHHQAALKHLFNIDKMNPENVHFHDTAKKLLHALSSKRESYTHVFDVYKEYASLAKPKISPAQYLRLATIFIATGHISHAEKIAKVLVSKKGDTPGIPELLLKMSYKYQKEGLQEKSAYYKNLLAKKYPEAAGNLNPSA